MISQVGRLVVVFNGEIYDDPKLRSELENDGAKFRTTSDTEVLLHLYAQHGPVMVHRLRGMFAFKGRLERLVHRLVVLGIGPKTSRK